MAHTLTWSSSFITSVTVNGNTITSPYTLQNNDVISVTVHASNYDADLWLTVNGVDYQGSGINTTLNLSDTDIVLSALDASGGGNN